MERTWKQENNQELKLDENKENLEYPEIWQKMWNKSKMLAKLKFWTEESTKTKLTRWKTRKKMMKKIVDAQQQKSDALVATMMATIAEMTATMAEMAWAADTKKEIKETAEKEKKEERDEL